MENEIDTLVDAGAEALCINDEIFLLNTFESEGENVNLNKKLESCKLRNSDGDCIIQECKPFTCRLFPIMLVQYKDYKYYWVFGRECSYYDHLESSCKLESKIKEFREILTSISPDLYREITGSFFKSRKVVEYIYPEEEVMIICEI